MSTTTLSQPATHLERLAYSIEESAIMLGVSHWTVRAWVRAGSLAASRVHGRTKILIPRAALEGLLERNFVDAGDKIT
jgi:excisionase family DNA binding protein